MSKRKEGETFKEYRDRQKVENLTNKLRARGIRTLWNSSQQGTYTIAKNGPIGDVRQTGSEKRIALRAAKQAEVANV